ncbi:MAG TPA: imidazolonepropionase [Acidimicrobiia bacterium]|nr:imidazolonepropionase [Acidimicrobiia bacterium]
MSDLFLTGITNLSTNQGPGVTDAVVAVESGVVTYAGPAAHAPSQTGERIDCGQRAVIPGFVDSHTHLVFAGDRSDEFARRMAGESYAEIAASGGGILSTVRDTRAASEQELYDSAAARVWRMIRAGTTTVEIKSGYGLDTETELRLLTVARRIGDELPVTVKTTFLGAHSVPAEFRSDRSGYIDLLIEEMLPAVAGLADYCDVFVEEGAFDVDEARRIFDRASALGLGARVHAEQLGHHGGAMLAAEIGAVSADHLDHVTDEDAVALAAAGVVAVLVPGASYTLRGPQAPGPLLSRAGCTLALATDCNPGTSYFESMGPVTSLAVVEMGLTVDQAIAAATLGGATALGMDDRGRIGSGAVADLVVLDAPSPAHIPYRPGTNLVWKTIKKGDVVGSW